MKKMKTSLILASLLLMIFSCNNDAGGTDDRDDVVKPKKETKIMCFGASRVQGARPLFESYRYELWKKLVENKHNFDFIGTKKDLPIAKYPDFQGKSFDRQHEGRSGWTALGINIFMNTWMKKSEKPDIVLFSSPGGNDMLFWHKYEKTLINIRTIIDKIQMRNPNVTIVIESPAPGHTKVMSNRLKLVFGNFKKDVYKIAKEETTLTSKIMVIDMAKGFKDDFFADPVHYNEKGAKFVASRYYTVLKDLLD